jgi:hypothetical protein
MVILEWNSLCHLSSSLSFRLLNLSLTLGSWNHISEENRFVECGDNFVHLFHGEVFVNFDVDELFGLGRVGSVGESS